MELGGSLFVLLVAFPCVRRLSRQGFHERLGLTQTPWLVEDGRNSRNGRRLFQIPFLLLPALLGRGPTPLPAACTCKHGRSGHAKLQQLPEGDSRRFKEITQTTARRRV